MTIASQISTAAFAGNGVSAEFPLPFRFMAAADVAVVLRSADGTETLLSEGTDYALSGAGAASGGTCVLGSPPLPGQTLVLTRAPRIVQETDYQENDAFPAESHEAALDLLTMICQALDEKIARAPLVKVSAPVRGLSLGDPAPGRALVWGADGLALEPGPDAADIAQAQGYAAQAAQIVDEIQAAQAGAEAAQAGAEAAQAGAEAAQAGAEAVLSSALHIDQNLADVGSVPAARANLDVYSQDDVDALLTRHSFAAGKSADQTGIASATWTKITYTAEEYDHGSVYDAANSRLTPGRAGVWLIGALVNFTAGIVDQSAYQCAIYKNGAPYRASYSRASGTNSLSAALVCTVEVDADDYIEIYAYGAGTGDKTVGSIAWLTSFYGVELARG